MTESLIEPNRDSPTEPLFGWLIVDKPGGMSSNDVLNRLRRGRRKLKIGHAGTLDPLATGLLLVAVGPATRLVESTQRLTKTYQARIRLGAVSPTDDADGLWTENPEAEAPAITEIESAMAPLQGAEVLQTPPAYSALHIAGQRAYELARRGDEVALAARPVRIDRITILAYEWPFLDIEMDCGSGTYVRSVARDLGNALGVGGMIETLRRTRIGPFDVSDAQPLERFGPDADLTKWLKPAETALVDWPKRVLTPDECAKSMRGQSFRIDTGENSSSSPSAEIALLDESGRLIALARCEADDTGLVVQPFRVFVTSTPTH